jgi:hypothetical protein
MKCVIFASTPFFVRHDNILQYQCAHLTTMTIYGVDKLHEIVFDRCSFHDIDKVFDRDFLLKKKRCYQSKCFFLSPPQVNLNIIPTV